MNLRKTNQKFKSPYTTGLHIPIEILTSIVSKLPIKSIVQCKCVSKSLNNFISDPSFTNIHHKNLPTNSFTLLVQKDEFSPSLDLIEFEEYNIVNENKCTKSDCIPRNPNACGYVSFGGNCHGLICFMEFKLGYYKFFVTNPMFNDIIRLPPLKVTTPTPLLSLAYGLGFSHFLNRYKVLTIITQFLKDGDYTIKVQILTVGIDKKWRIVRDSNVPYNLNTGYFRQSNMYSSMVAFGSALHWLVMPTGCWKPKWGDLQYICAFDMTEEKIYALPLPPEIVAHGQRCNNGCLTVLRDKLCLFEGNKERFTIWVMEEYGVEGLWMNRFVLSASLLPAHYVMNETVILTLSAEGVIVLSDGRYFIFYDLEANSFERVVHLVNNVDFFPIPYVPSFVPLKNLIKGK